MKKCRERVTRYENAKFRERVTRFPLFSFLAIVTYVIVVSAHVELCPIQYSNLEYEGKTPK